MRYLAALSLAAIGSWSHATEPFSYRTPMEKTGSGNYYVHGSVGSSPQSRFLVDTGSGYVVLTPGTFRNAKRNTTVKFERNITGRMADGSLLEVPLYRISLLQVGNGCLLREVEVTVLKGSDRNILGLSALRKVQPFAMDLDAPALYLSNCSGEDPAIDIARRSETQDKAY